MPKTFADFTPAPARRSGCRICGEPIAGDVALSLRARGGGNPKPKHIAGRSWGFCETHAIETFDRLVAELDRG